MRAFEPLPDPHDRPYRSFHYLVWKKGSLPIRVSMVLDGFGLFALVIAAISLLGTGISSKDPTAGRLIHLCITALNAGVLMLATARILEMTDKFRNRVDPGVQPYGFKRSADYQAFAAQQAPSTNAEKDVVAAPGLTRENTDVSVPGASAEVVYSPAWRTRAHTVAAPLKESGCQGETFSATLDVGAFRQTTDIPDSTAPKNIH